MRFAGPPPLTALDDVDIDVLAGDRVVVLGPSGSGKSTLLNVLGLLERPTSGTVTWRGREISRTTDAQLARIRATQIGFVFQTFHLIPDRTVRENVALPMAVQGVPRSQRPTRCDELIERVALAQRADGLARHLSGGEKQRVAVARALTGEPAMLLCDEPTGNLDSASSAAIMQLLSDINDSGTAVVLITHDLTWAPWGHRVLRVLDGRLQPQTEA